MQELSKDLQPGRHYCAQCHRITEWYGERVQNCDGCGAPFPCPYVRCDHQDCLASRSLWGAGDDSDMFLILE
jgi:hypothetical protein